MIYQSYKYFIFAFYLFFSSTYQNFPLIRFERYFCLFSRLNTVQGEFLVLDLLMVKFLRDFGRF